MPALPLMREISAEVCINATIWICSIGVLQSALEYLSLRNQFCGRGFYSGELHDLRWSSGPWRPLYSVLRPDFAVAAVSAARASAAICALLVPYNYVWLPLAVMFVGQLATHYRCRYGLEGADQMTAMVLAMSCVATVYPGASTQNIALGFIAAQSCLSYFIAGISKLRGRAWRSGTAVRDIMRTQMSGRQSVWVMFRRYPSVAVALNHGIIAFECAFPLVLVMPRPAMLAYLGCGALFHLANALVMGLNAFVWAFVATYPAIFFWSSRILQAA